MNNLAGPLPSQHSSGPSRCRGVRAVLAVGSLTLAALFVPSRALATTYYLQYAWDLRMDWLASFPRTWSTDELDQHADSVRTVPAGTLRATGSDLVLLGSGLTLGLTVRDRWVFSLFGFQMAGAVGARRSQSSSRDGTLVELHPWTVGRFTVLLPGVGVRVKFRRWTLQGNLGTGVAISWMHAYASLGSSVLGFEPIAITPLARAEVQLCRRIDPTFRTCLAVGVNLYDSGWLNGGFAAIRLEGGP